VSVDCLDMEIVEPGPFSLVLSPKWFSHKFNGPGLRYEVALCIATGDIVWINGPFPCGMFSDWVIFRDFGLRKNLERNERVEADDGYAAGDPEWVKTRSGILHIDKGMRNNVRARQEVVNKRLKQWNVLCHVFRHNISHHGDAFRAVAVITQLSFDYGERLFQIEGYGGDGE